MDKVAVNALLSEDEISLSPNDNSFSEWTHANSSTPYPIIPNTQSAKIDATLKTFSFKRIGLCSPPCATNWANNCRNGAIQKNLVAQVKQAKDIKSTLPTISNLMVKRRCSDVRPNIISQQQVFLIVLIIVISRKGYT